MKKTTKRKSRNLFDQAVKLTGIPSSSIREELKTILKKKNMDIKHLTLDELRRVAASYLREIMAGLLDKTSGKRTE